tara:strand:+ start:26919 stop:27749 length:831 start_codon:yes stop_codon:yes gene_type:complete
MSLIDNIAQSEAMLGFHDPTFGVDAIARIGGGAKGEGGEEEGFFETLLDVINPLQHIPLVSNLYREITGDEISPSARILGGGLFGGPIGLASATANAIFEQASGDDLMGHALAMVSGDSEPKIAAQQANAGGRTDTDIVLAGPPALASVRAAPMSLAPPVMTPAAPVIPAPPPVNAALATPAAPKVVKTAVIDQMINSDAPTTPEPKTDANARALPTNWVNEALRDAATMNEALQNGAAPEIGGTKPWVGNAILDALSKYDALTKARGESALNGPS